MIDTEELDQRLQEYMAEHPFDELEHRRILALAWRETGGRGGLAGCHRWARAWRAREGSGSFWGATARMLRATGCWDGSPGRSGSDR